jgi:hypothetical protein
VKGSIAELFMNWTSVAHAYAYWSRHKGRPNPPSDLDEAEAFVLKGRPVTATDAACMLDVVCASFGDGRCDGLDLVALRHVREFLAEGI